MSREMTSQHKVFLGYSLTRRPGILSIKGLMNYKGRDLILQVLGMYCINYKNARCRILREKS